jgi:anti-sigma regulatory factor (Ser/Thr protein kinase)
VLVLYSDGLIERRGEPISDGLERLAQAAGIVAAVPLGEACERIINDLTAGHDHDDDVVAMCVRFGLVTATRFHRVLPAHPSELAAARGALREWMTARGTPESTQWRVLLAAGEALANAVEHAYSDSPPGTIDLMLGYDDEDALTVQVRDRGRWQSPATAVPNRGHGSNIIEALAGGFDRQTDAEGTTLRFRITAVEPPHEEHQPQITSSEATSISPK